MEEIMDDKFRLLFGDENAERDPLLQECAVRNRRVSASKPILTGRWGTGKTAILLLQNADLSKTLKSIDDDYERLWYLDESTLDLNSLLELQSRLAPTDSGPLERDLFLRALQGVWKAEILRVFRQVLAALWNHYGQPQGPHWDFVKKADPAHRSRTALWQQLPIVLTSLLSKQDASHAVTTLETTVQDLFSDSAYRHIRQCLREVSGSQIQPMVAIEPIETPTSKLEVGDKGIAQAIVTALLNVYNSDFAPTANNPFVVRISIPWHRFDTKSLDFPQKLFQYRGHVQWAKADLKALVNRRILWELRRVGRTVHANEAWAEIFPNEIPNGICDPQVNEDSFDYFLRHTHHRARDILRLVRTSVESHAEEHGADVDDVLRHRRATIGIPVIKDNFRKVCSQATRELLSEAARRYPEILKLEAVIRGMSQPFNLDDLKRRIEPLGISVLRAAEVLWEAGVLGATAVPGDTEASRALTSVFTNDARMSYRNREGTSLERWTWYEYNWDGDLSDILAKLATVNLESSGIVFHPKTYEYFSPTHKGKLSPVGC